MVGSSGLEPPTSRLSGVRSNHLSYEPIYVAEHPAFLASRPTFGGDEQNRTVDPLLARQVLSQLSYTPVLNGWPLGFCSTSSFVKVPLSRALKIKQRIDGLSLSGTDLGCWNSSLELFGSP